MTWNRTRGHKMVGTVDSTELWRPPGSFESLPKHTKCCKLVANLTTAIRFRCWSCCIWSKPKVDNSLRKLFNHFFSPSTKLCSLFKASCSTAAAATLSLKRTGAECQNKNWWEDLWYAGFEGSYWVKSLTLIPYLHLDNSYLYSQFLHTLGICLSLNPKVTSFILIIPYHNTSIKIFGLNRTCRSCFDF